MKSSIRPLTRCATLLLLALRGTTWFDRTRARQLPCRCRALPSPRNCGTLRSTRFAVMSTDASISDPTATTATWKSARSIRLYHPCCGRRPAPCASHDPTTSAPGLIDPDIRRLRRSNSPAHAAPNRPSPITRDRARRSTNHGPFHGQSRSSCDRQCGHGRPGESHRANAAHEHGERHDVDRGICRSSAVTPVERPHVANADMTSNSTSSTGAFVRCVIVIVEIATIHLLPRDDGERRTRLVSLGIRGGTCSGPRVVTLTAVAVEAEPPPTNISIEPTTSEERRDRRCRSPRNHPNGSSPREERLGPMRCLAQCLRIVEFEREEHDRSDEDRGRLVMSVSFACSDHLRTCQ